MKAALFCLVFVAAILDVVAGAENPDVVIESSSYLVIRNGSQFYPAETKMTCFFPEYPDEALTTMLWRYRELFSDEAELKPACLITGSPFCQVSGVKVDGSSLTIDHAKFQLNSTLIWNCLLLSTDLKKLPGQSESPLFFVDISEEPKMVQKRDIEIPQDKSTVMMEFECSVPSVAPNTTFEWLLDEMPVFAESNVSKSNLELSVSRDDCGKTLKCVVTHLHEDGAQIGDDLEAEIDLKINVVPVLMSQRQHNGNYEFEINVQASRIEYAQFSPMDNLDKDDILTFSEDLGVWKRNIVPASSNFVYNFQTFNISTCVTRIQFAINISALDAVNPNLEDFYARIGNKKTGSFKTAIGIKRQKGGVEYNEIDVIPSGDATLSQDDNLEQGSVRQEMATEGVGVVVIIVVSVVVAVLFLAFLVVGVKYRKPISERFQRREYKVPTDDQEDVEGSGDQEQPIIRKKPAAEKPDLCESEI